jgi:hypothetical protein
MVRTAEDASHHSVNRRNDSATMQGKYDPALVHDGAGE